MEPTGAEVVDERELARRVIEPDQFVADPQAFVDVRLPESRGKASYSLIGPGVSQNDDQVVNLREPHGFNVGAASSPAGVVNNQHLHYTAEVFICTRGKWRMRVGADAERTFDISSGTIFSAPTWIFRGFENIGDDDSWLFVVLGGDETGGILWAPEVLRRSAETGLHLSADNIVLDAHAGDDVTEAQRPTEVSDDDVDGYDDAALAERVVAEDDLEWSDRALLSVVLPGHASAIAPVIGSGLTQDRRQRPPITNPHTFSLEWLRVEAGCSTGRHRIAEPTVLLLVDGHWELTLNSGEDRRSTRPQPGSVVSVPPGAWRDLANTGDGPARAIVVGGTDAPNRIDWAPEIVTAASDAGFVLDASGYIAPRHLTRGSS